MGSAMGAYDTLQLDFADQGRAPALRQPLMQHGFRLEIVDLATNDPYAFRAHSDWHYLAYHDLTLVDGELLIDGLPRLAETELRETLTFAPAGCSISGWSKPAERKNSFVALYFDPARLRPELGERYALLDPGPFAYARDQALSGTMAKLRSVASAPDLDPLYTETLCLAAALEVFGVTPAGSGRLSDRQLKAVHDFVEANLGRKIGLDDLATLAGFSRSHFSRSFKETTGVGPHQFVRRRQMARACELLDSASRPSVAEVAQRVGFMSANVFRRAFQKSFGIPPQAYRRKGD
jgi:AraC family transcriptional regulator